MRVVAAARFRLVVAAVLAATGLGFGISAAFQQPGVDVVVQDPATRPPMTSGGGAAAPAMQPIGTPTTANSTCTTPQPPGDWVCQNGVWMSSTAASNGGAPTSGLPGAASSVVAAMSLVPYLPGAASSNLAPSPMGVTCSTPQPGPTWVCENGSWLSVGSGSAAVTNTGIPTTNYATPTPAYVTCPMPQPVGAIGCQDGAWVMGGPGAPAVTTSPGCSAQAPGPNYSCMNGVWMTTAPGAPSSAPNLLPGGNPGVPAVPGQVACAGDPPGPGFTCVNGAWVIKN